MAPRLYDRARWKTRRAAFLKTNPLCKFCTAAGRATLATVVHHDPPHQGNPVKFFDETTWVSLCKPCHDGAAVELENTGRIRGCDIHGRPLDPNHHWNREG